MGTVSVCRVCFKLTGICEEQGETKATLDYKREDSQWQVECDDAVCHWPKGLVK